MNSSSLYSLKKKRSWMPGLLAGLTFLIAACADVPTPTRAPDSPYPLSAATPPITITPPPATTPLQTFLVSAERGWDTLGLYVRPGQQFEVTATGSWSHEAEGILYGPGGAGRSEPDSTLPSAPIGALIGRIGDNPPFEIGEHAVLTADYGGELWVSINDHLGAPTENSGSLEVAVALGPEPSDPTQLLTNEIDGYRLLVPAGYQAVIYENGMCLTPTGAWMMACHVANAFIEVSAAGGRTLDQVADELTAEGNPDIPVRRTNLTISGVDAILLDDIYAYDVLRKVVIVHDDHTYLLTFAPWRDSLEDFTRLENLYDTVIRSFAFLPQPDSATPPEEATESRVTAVSPVAIYSGPGGEHPPVGTLAAGVAARVIGGQEGEYWPDRWMNIACPEGITGDCWVLWDMNALHPYEGPPAALNIPDPASLRIESSHTETSPDGRWQALATESEKVSLDGDLAFFFYVELTATSLEEGTSWTPVSEWHVYGLGLEPAPRPFYWSQDGHYLYYTSITVPDGGCGYFANSGESLDRLDLTDGTVAVLPPPRSRGILALSPDETRMAYLSYIDGYQLIVRDLGAAYTSGTAGGNSIQWQIPLDLVLPEAVSQIAWTPDGGQVLLTVTEVADNCQPARTTEWELDVATGEFGKVSNMDSPATNPPDPNVSSRQGAPNDT